MSLSIREKVFQTADELLVESGRTPSIRQILEKTGGSSTTIQKYLKEWQEEQARRAQRPGFPLPVQRALGEAWDQLVAAAKQVFDEEREGYETRLQSLDTQIQDLERQLAEALARATAREAELLEIQRLADQEARRRREVELEAEGLRGQVALALQAVEATTRQMAEEREAHRQAVDSLKAAHAQEIARHQELVERSENHLLRQVDEVRRQAEQLKARHAEEIGALNDKLDRETIEQRKRTDALMLEIRDAHVMLSRERTERTHLENEKMALTAEISEIRRQRDEARVALATETAARQCEAPA